MITHKAIAANADQYLAHLEYFMSIANDDHINNGLTFYNEAHDHCKKRALVHGLTVDQYVGGLAALSPGCYYQKNVIDIETVITYGDQVLIDDRLRVSTYGNNVHKCLKIIDGFDTAENVLANDRYKKVISFYHNIMDPFSADHVTVDVWGLRALVDPLLHKDKARNYCNTSRKYHECSRIYKTIAADHGLLPCQAQAIIWFVIRDLYGRSVSFLIDDLRSVTDHVKSKAFYLGIGV